jgi:hypothetical protein
MKGRGTLLLLVIVFAGMGGALFLQNAETDSPPQPTPTFQRLFTDLAIDDLQAIELRMPTYEQPLIFVREPDGSWSAPDIIGELDQEAVSNMAATLVILPYRRTFSIDADTDLGQYGISPTPDFIVQFITFNGEQHSIAFGDPSFESLTFYTLVDDRQQVYLVERPPVDYLVTNFINPPILQPD